ncbi:response regulator [Alkalinema sp. FACHB-956]|uniref:response regulator n=1 Tax=Alkalinema sp. FACHB-956 TaxID=2692768 RepID=UPI0016895C39|nr:response regulator [Alkalinema sp. FACHB-956]MBD2330022.1 response regulator [Alkalinema sp. FACHB-956]
MTGSIPKHILIIDDEMDIQAVARLALKTVAGWQVTTASSGIEGVTRAKQLQPDAILLDVMMPDVDGLSTLQQLQADPQTRSIPVILMTAKMQLPDMRKFSTLGITAVITKPFKAMQLAEQIAQALAWQG